MEKRKNSPLGGQPSSTTILVAIIIAAGVFLFLGASGIISALITVLVVGLLILALLGPVMGLYGKPEIKQGRFDEPLGQATSASVRLDLAVAEAKVGALQDSENLIEADLTYVGEIDFNVSGDHEKQVELRQTARGLNFPTINPFNWIGSRQPLRWEVYLSPKLPLALKINSGVGKSEYDLRGLDLSALQVNCGVGSLEMRLPASRSRYEAAINGGAGEVKVEIEDDADVEVQIGGGLGELKVFIGEGAVVNARIKSGMGAVTVTLPREAPARVRADMGVGDLSLPSRFSRISGEERVVGQHGVWETEHCGDYENPITIEFSGGVGGLTIR